MGANCCVPMRRDNHVLISYGNGVEDAHRNVSCSPPWSIRWDNRTHVADIRDYPARFHNSTSYNSNSEIKSGAETETESHSDEGSVNDATHERKTSPFNSSTLGNHRDDAADKNDQSIGRNSSIKEKDSTSTPKTRNLKLSIPLPSFSSSSTCTVDPSSSRNHSLPSEPNPRKVNMSPGYQLSSQVSDTKIPTLKCLDEDDDSPDRTKTFNRHISNDDVPNGGSQGGGSSDGWSMRTFSELVASSQRERWSVDSVNLSSKYSKSARSDAQSSLASPSPDRQVCRVCTEPLKERPNWTSNELSVIAVLVCGHVYHAECLESETPAAKRFDPPCPLCVYGEKSASKPAGRESRKAKNRISRRAVADIDTDGNGSEQRKSADKGKRAIRSVSSSSMKSAFTRHFSIGPRAKRSVSENESTRKIGFWAWYKSSIRD